MPDEKKSPPSPADDDDDLQSWEDARDDEFDARWNARLNP